MHLDNTAFRLYTHTHYIDPSGVRYRVVLLGDLSEDEGTEFDWVYSNNGGCCWAVDSVELGDISNKISIDVYSTSSILYSDCFDDVDSAIISSDVVEHNYGFKTLCKYKVVKDALQPVDCLSVQPTYSIEYYYSPSASIDPSSVISMSSSLDHDISAGPSASPIDSPSLATSSPIGHSSLDFSASPLESADDDNQSVITTTLTYEYGTSATSFSDGGLDSTTTMTAAATTVSPTITSISQQYSSITVLPTSSTRSRIESTSTFTSISTDFSSSSAVTPTPTPSMHRVYYIDYCHSVL